MPGERNYVFNGNRGVHLQSICRGGRPANMNMNMCQYGEGCQRRPDCIYRHPRDEQIDRGDGRPVGGGPWRGDAGVIPMAIAREDHLQANNRGGPSNYMNIICEYAVDGQRRPNCKHHHPDQDEHNRNHNNSGGGRGRGRRPGGYGGGGGNNSYSNSHSNRRNPSNNNNSNNNNTYGHGDGTGGSLSDLCIPFLSGGTSCRFIKNGSCRKRHPPTDDIPHLLARFKQIRCRHLDACYKEGCLFLHPIRDKLSTSGRGSRHNDSSAESSGSESSEDNFATATRSTLPTVVNASAAALDQLQKVDEKQIIGPPPGFIEAHNGFTPLGVVYRKKLILEANPTVVVPFFQL